MKELKISITEFEEWLRKNYLNRFGEIGIRAFLKPGLGALFFANSELLYII